MIVPFDNVSKSYTINVKVRGIRNPNTLIPLKLVLDTGATRTVISEIQLKTLGVKPNDNILRKADGIQLITGEIYNAYFLDVKEIFIGNGFIRCTNINQDITAKIIDTSSLKDNTVNNIAVLGMNIIRYLRILQYYDIKLGVPVLNIMIDPNQINYGEDSTKPIIYSELNEDIIISESTILNNFKLIQNGVLRRPPKSKQGADPFYSCICEQAKNEYIPVQSFY